MIRYFFFFCFICFHCLGQTESTFTIELDNFLKKEAKKVTESKLGAIKKAVYHIELFSQNKLQTSQIDSLYNSATQLVEKEKIVGLLSWVYAKHGLHYFYLGFYNKALPYFLKSYNLANKLPENVLFRPIDIYQENGYFLGEIGNYDRSITLLKKAIQKENTTTENYRTLTNVVGRYFYRKGDVENAKIYFNETLDLATKSNDLLRKSKVLGDFGLLSEDDKDFKKAENLLLDAIILAKKTGDKKHTMYCQLQLGKLYVKIKQLKKASDIIAKAESYILSKQHLQFFLHQIKIEQLKIAKLTHNAKQELHTRRYLDSLKIVLEKKESATLKKTINWEIEHQNFEQKLENKKVQLQKQQLIKWASIIVLLLIILLIFSFYIASRRKLKLKIAQNEEFISRIKLEKLTSEQNLAKTTHNLLSYKAYLQEKNKQIEKLEKEINKVHKQTSINSVTHKNRLETLLNSHLMTDENWMKFKQSFIEEFPSFYNAFIKENSDISETSLRIVFLHKLHLSNQEISNLLGISIAGVKKSKQRLRKKVTDFDEL